MKIMAVDRMLPGKSYEDVKPHLKKEAEHAWKNYEKGIFRELYMRGGRAGAVIILECGGVDEARAVMAELPLVKEKVIEFEYTVLEPFMPFASLFGR